jgi:uncharacterized protein YpmS
MKFFSGCLVGLLLGVLLSVFAVVGYTLFNTSDLVPMPPSPSISDADLTITIRQQYLNDHLRAGLAARGMNASDLAVILHAQNRAEATMTTALSALGQSITVHPHALFHFGLTNGKITLEIDQVDVSGLAIPQDIVNQQMGTLRQYAEDQLNSEMKRMLANSGLRVVGIQTAEGSLTVQLSR